MPILLKYLAQRHLKQPDDSGEPSKTIIAACASAIKAAIGDSETDKTLLVNWCTSVSGAGLGHGAGIRRAVVAALGNDRDAITQVFEKSLAQFGDEIYVKHAAIIQQESELYSRTILQTCTKDSPVY